MRKVYLTLVRKAEETDHLEDLETEGRLGP